MVLKKSSSANVTNLFIANMAVADLLLTLTAMPYTVAFLFRGCVWFEGTLSTIACKAVFSAIRHFHLGNCFNNDVDFI